MQDTALFAALCRATMAGPFGLAAWRHAHALRPVLNAYQCDACAACQIFGAYQCDACELVRDGPAAKCCVSTSTKSSKKTSTRSESLILTVIYNYNYIQKTRFFQRHFLESETYSMVDRKSKTLII